ncbi:MAG: allose kinase [Eubacteriales bacterium]
MKENSLILGLDIGGTHLRIGMVNESKTVAGFEIHSSIKLLIENPIQNLTTFIKEYVSRHGCEKNIFGVTIGFPSTIDKNRKKVLSTPNIKGLNQLNVVQELEENLGYDVFIERDVNLLLQYDTFMHRVDPNGTILGFYFGTGLGNAIQIGGKIYNGKNGTAGELGHIPVMNDKSICGCGNMGCMENYASGKYLQHLKSSIFKNTRIEDIFVNHSGHSNIKQYIDYLSLPIATEINILDPDFVILGGGVLQMEGFPFKLLEENIFKHARKPYPAGNLKIAYSVNHQENGVIGAGIHGFKCKMK